MDQSWHTAAAATWIFRRRRRDDDSGSGDGRLELWNVKRQARIHAYASLSKKCGAVLAVEPSGALDVVAVARASGAVALVDARKDVQLFALDHGAAAAALCFCRGGEPRGAGAARPPLLVTGGADGALKVWDLEERRLLHAERAAHKGGVLALRAGGVGGGPGGADAVVATSLGADGHLRQWAFDAADGAPREVRRRAGLGGPPSLIRWYGPPACGGSVARGAGDAYGSLQLLAASAADRGLWALHAARDRLNGELSQGKGGDARAKRLRLSDPRALRLPPVIAVAATDAKEGGGFPNVVTRRRRAGRRETSPSRECIGTSSQTLRRSRVVGPRWTRTGATRASASRAAGSWRSGASRATASRSRSGAVEVATTRARPRTPTRRTRRRAASCRRAATSRSSATRTATCASTFSARLYVSSMHRGDAAARRRGYSASRRGPETRTRSVSTPARA